MDRGVKTEKKSNRITFRLTSSEVETLHKECVSRDKNVYELIRTALKKAYSI